MLLLLRVQGLTSAAELFPGWGHPALWCPSARPTPWSWRCPEARERDGRVKEGRGERREGSWRWGWREASAEMTKVTKCMPERGDRRENVQIGKGGKKRGKGGWEQRGQEWCAWGEGSTLLIRLIKQKTWEGNTQTPCTAMERARVPDNTWMRRNEQAREC